MNTSKRPDSTPDMTSEEMVAQSSDWSLAFDNALLNRLKKFSEIVDASAQEINNECGDLSKDIGLLKSRVVNVTNEFLMLSNTQFVENRVQEFEETMEAKNVSSPNQEKARTKAEKEAELIAKMKEAIHNGVSLNNFQDKAQSSTHRQLQDSNTPKLNLPYLIGTSKFFSSKYCGLADDNKTFLTISDDSCVRMDDSTNSSKSIKSNSSESLPSIYKSQDNIPEVLFSQDNNNSANDESCHNNSSLVKRVQVRDSPDLYKDTHEVPFTKPTSSIVNDLNNALQARMCPPLDKTESDSEDDFKPLASGQKLFDADDEDDLFGENSLFANREIDDEFLFDKPANSSVSFPKPSKDAPPQPSVLASGNTRKIPAGAVSMFGGHPPKSVIKDESYIKGNHQSTGGVQSNSTHLDEEMEADSSQTSENRSTTASHSSLMSDGSKVDGPTVDGKRTLNDKQASNTKNRVLKSTKNSLFDDNSDEDLFTSIKSDFKKRSNNKLFDDDSAKQPTDSNTKSSLFKAKTNVRHSIFEDSDSGDDLFSSASSTSSKSKEKNIVKNPNPFFKPSSSLFSGRATDSLFDDKYDDDIFVREKKVKDDIANSHDVFSTKKSVSSIKETHLSTSKINVDSLDMKGNDNAIHSNSSVVSPLPSCNISKNQDILSKDQSKIPESASAKHLVVDADKGHGAHDTSVIETRNKVDVSVADIHNRKISISEKDLNLNMSSQPEANNSEYSDNAPVMRPKSLHIQSGSVPSNKIHSSIQVKANFFSENMNQVKSNTPVDQNSSVISNSNITSPSTINQSLQNDSSTEGLESNVKAKVEVKALKSSVKVLANSLKINPLALRPGFKPLKPEARSLEQESESLKVETHPASLVTVDSSGLLTSISKDRPKILKQRRPPSRNLRRGVSQSTVVDGSLESNEVTENKSVESPDIPSVAKDQSEPNSPVVPGDILSPSTEEEDIFAIGTVSSHNPVFGTGEMRTDNKHVLLSPELNDPTDGPHITKTLANSFFNEEVQANLLPLPPNSDLSCNAETNKPSQNQKPKVPTAKRIALPSSKITQCSDSDSDDIFSSIGRKSKNLSLHRSKENVNERVLPPTNDLFADIAKENSYSVNQSESITPNDMLDVERCTNPVEKETHVEKTKIESNSKSTTQNRVINKIKSVFSDDENETDDEDIFKTKSKTPILAPGKKEHVATVVKISTVNAVPASSSTLPKKQGLFDSDSDDDDQNLFGSKSKKPSAVSGVQVPKIAQEASIKRNSRNKAPTTSLFNDSSDDDIFASSSSKSAATRNSISSIKNITSSSSKEGTGNQIAHLKKPVKQLPDNDIFDDPLNSIG